MIYDVDQVDFEEQLDEVQQGVIKYIERGTTTGDPWNPTAGASTEHTLKAVATGVSQKYVDGTFIVSTDLEVTSSVFAVMPNVSGTVSIDGQEMQVVKAWKIPAAGTPISYKMIVRA